MLGRDFLSSDLGKLVKGLRKTVEEARNSGLDLSEVYPPRDSTTYRIQSNLRLSCSDVMVKYVDSFAGFIDPDKELLTEVLDLIAEATNMFGKFKPAKDYVEGAAAFIVQMTHANYPHLIPQQHLRLLEYELPKDISSALKSR